MIALPSRLAAVPVEPSFEDGFMSLLRERDVAAAPPTDPMQRSDAATTDAPSALPRGAIVLEVSNLVRRFGTFTTVDQVRAAAGNVAGRRVEGTMEDAFIAIVGAAA